MACQPCIWMADCTPARARLGGKRCGKACAAMADMATATPPDRAPRIIHKAGQRGSMVG